MHANKITSKSSAINNKTVVNEIPTTGSKAEMDNCINNKIWE